MSLMLMRIYLKRCPLGQDDYNEIVTDPLDF